MSAIRAVLVAAVVAAAMVVAIRHVPVEQQKADAAISIEALRGVGLMRAADTVAPPQAEKPMLLPPLEAIPIPPPPVAMPARPAPKIEPPKPPKPIRVALWRPAPPREHFCSRFGMHKVQYGKQWRCRR
jgi:hypothetical protein